MIARPAALALVLGAALVAPRVRADDALPPWMERSDVPVPAWARSVAPNRAETAIYAEPGKLELRRGSAQPGARLPLYGTRRAAGCQGRWLLVGPHAWVCSDVADFTGDEPQAPSLGSRPWNVDGVDPVRPARPGARALPPIEAAPNDDGLPYRYFFAGREGAYGFVNLDTALDDAADQELEPGFAVAVLEERSAHGQRWGRTKKGRWVALRELVPSRPFTFHGVLLDDGDGDVSNGARLDLGWVVTERAPTFATEKADRATSSPRARFDKVRVYDARPGVVRISENGTTPVWMRTRDLAIPSVTAPPPDAGAFERWIDVDLAQQTLVAYEGVRPVFATIVSTGKGPQGSELATRTGIHRIWVKIFTTKMDNLDRDEVERHYAIEDVPWVQFFDKAIALHGAFWHRDFGHIHSHGCVNLAPLDARWLFAFTGPHLPAGWTAVMPSKIEPGTIVRVR